jgi:pimeloyl-ACP methyl ester carboxylesterase
MNSGTLREGVTGVAGGRSPYLEAGPPTAAAGAVFMHGDPGSARAWEDLVRDVGACGRAVALDVPGYGRAAKPAGFAYTVDGSARHLGQCPDQLAIRRAHLVVRDFGGPWGFGLGGQPARRVPECRHPR